MAIQDELPKSRITLTYRTTINGEPETVNLPFRVMMLGDFSKGTSTDRKSDLDERKPRTLDGKNLNDVMKDMNMSLSFTVANHINPNVSADLPVSLPITNMKSFDPDTVVQQVPELKALLLLRTLILEMQRQVDNRKDLRQQLHNLFANSATHKQLLDELKDFQALKLPPAPPAQ